MTSISQELHSEKSARRFIQIMLGALHTTSIISTVPQHLLYEHFSVDTFWGKMRSQPRRIPAKMRSQRMWECFLIRIECLETEARHRQNHSRFCYLASMSVYRWLFSGLVVSNSEQSVNRKMSLHSSIPNWTTIFSGNRWKLMKKTWLDHRGWLIMWGRPFG